MIETFEEFVKRILALLFWFILLSPLIIFPILFLLVPIFGIDVTTVNEILTATILLFIQQR